MNELRDYVVESAAKKREYALFSNINVFVKDFPESDEVDIPSLIQHIEKLIPRHFFEDIEVIYIGQFDILGDRNAAYEHGGIYVTNGEQTNFDILEDIIHETAHAIEKRYIEFLYDDHRLANEFLGKRRRLRSILEEEGFHAPLDALENTEYSKNFDYFLKDTVGYPLLLTLTMGLFVSPYAATSLSEYFADGVEKFYLGEVETVRQISPELYKKITYLHSLENDA